MRNIDINIKMSIPENVPMETVAQAIENLIASHAKQSNVLSVGVSETTDLQIQAEKILEDSKNLLFKLQRKNAYRHVTINGEVESDDKTAVMTIE